MKRVGGFWDRRRANRAPPPPVDDVPPPDDQLTEYQGALEWGFKFGVILGKMGVDEETVRTLVKIGKPEFEIEIRSKVR